MSLLRRIIRHVWITKLHSAPNRGCSQYHREKLLNHFPRRLVYLTECRCFQLQKKVYFDPLGKCSKGSLDRITKSPLDGECTGIGEVYVSKDGLIHPEEGFGPKAESVSGHNPEDEPEEGCEHLRSVPLENLVDTLQVYVPVTFHRYCQDLAYYVHLSDLVYPYPGTPLPIWAKTVPEQAHVWEIPQGEDHRSLLISLRADINHNNRQALNFLTNSSCARSGLAAET